MTQYIARLTGTADLITHCGAKGLAEDSPIKREIAAIAKVTASKRSDQQRLDLVALESLNSLWTTPDGLHIEIPWQAVRAVLEAAARQTKDGPRVRQGARVLSTAFNWDREQCGEDGTDEKIKALAGRLAFTVPVVVGRAKTLRTRARFPLPWSITARLACDPDLMDLQTLQRWFDTAGARIGIGDWRPERSGIFGTFTAKVSPA